MITGVRIESVAHMENLMPLIMESLDAGQTVRFSPSGVSMLPMLRQGKDSVELSPVCGKLKKFDLPLYQRDDGKYVLHRIVAVSDTYTCMGDNQYIRETGIRQEQLIAQVTAFYRGKRRYEVDVLAYRLYCRLWHYSRPLRHLYRRGIGWICRHIGK